MQGEVERPMMYHYKETDTIEDLIKFSQGFTREANENRISITETQRWF